ncbi:MAG: hypothetical protein AAFV62_08405 [Pseudomonadota bacterium]
MGEALSEPIQEEKAGRENELQAIGRVLEFSIDRAKAIGALKLATGIEQVKETLLEDALKCRDCKGLH